MRLSQDPEYEALSYMWGSADNLNTIDIEGKEFRIGQNLWQALKQLRHSKVPRLLWIDAICINQDDTAERNHQVNQMSLIYSKAIRVIIWLGLETEHSHQAISFLKMLRGLPVLEYDLLDFKAHWESVLGLCQMEYWGRLWIIQEVLLASQIIVCCGTDTMAWDILNGVREHLVIGRRSHTWNFSTIEAFHQTIPAQLSRYRSGKRFRLLDDRASFSLTDLFFEFQHSACKDGRDKLFGLLSLSAVCCKVQIPVDYSISAFEICNHALTHHLQGHTRARDLDLVKMTILAYRAHSACGVSKPTVKQLGNEMKDGVSTQPSKGLIGTIIYTSPLNRIIQHYGSSIPNSKSVLSRDHLKYLDSTWKYQGYTASPYGGDVRSVFIRQLHNMNYYDRSQIESLDREYFNAVRATTDVSNTTLAGVWEALNEKEVYEYIQIILDVFCRDPGRYLPSFQVKMFIDDNGFIGFGPEDLLPGDMIYETDHPYAITITRRTALGDQPVITAWKNYRHPNISDARFDFPGKAESFEHLLRCHLGFVTTRSIWPFSPLAQEWVATGMGTETG